MNILLVTPVPARSRRGNRVTAQRWAELLHDLGHRVQIAESYQGQPCELLIALHARKSADSIQRFSDDHPERPIVLALTGTDLYRDIRTSSAARRSLQAASRLVLLQPHGLHQLPEEVRDKARVIYQSVEPPATRPAPRTDVFEVCVIGHLRPVKDPFRAAKAARLLPASSRIRIVHFGAALSDKMEREARAEMNENPRYHWPGEVPREQALQRLTRSRLLVLSSHMEGGANAICEALAVGVPVLSSRISGSMGLLGEDYPGYFPVGDTEALARLLRRAEEDADFYETLQDRCRGRAELVDPARERESWRRLIEELN